ncbi:MAG TPA: poly(3-hydroxyalkanoate) depolymerase [Steroidobacteraceae bacterium]|nr:poly(3-hydroxyalkanoate) depolymerase [Steroidobacteraceae bacterium]
MSKPNVEFVEVDGVNLRVATQSGHAGPPLLLFNGIGANLELCFPFMEAMPEKEIIIFDVPGVGRSQMSWRPRRFSGLARLADKLLDRLGYQQVDVIGVSWGGALAQQFARQYPRRCRRLILAATSPGAVMVPGRPSVLSKMITPRRYLSPSYMQKTAGDIYGGETRRDPRLLSALTARIIPPQFMGYVYQLVAGLGWTSIHWLHRIRQPTLVMAGAEDPLVPPVNARIIALLIPNNRLFIVPGGGHLFMLHSIDKVVPVVRGFLDSEVPLAA